MKLTKEDIDKVRHIEGFPIAKDEDIIKYSNKPYYTSCPNPAIVEFLEKNATIYNESGDSYSKEPFASDISEGKNEPIYNAHTYHTKVPYKAIMKYILHYTDPGDVVFDGFCGTGMTGIAAQMCESPTAVLKEQFEHDLPYIKWGARKTIMNDISPAATFIAYNYNSQIDKTLFEEETCRIISECLQECGWMYKTKHTNNEMGEIIYTVWTDVLICPKCGEKIVFWDVAVSKNPYGVKSKFKCSNCSAELTKRECSKSKKLVYDSRLDTTIEILEQLPALISYTYNGKRYSKTPDKFDLDLIEEIDNLNIPYWYPIDRMCEGSESRRNDKNGITHVHHFYTKRNLYTLACLRSKNINQIPQIEFWYNSLDHGVSKRVKHGDWSFPMSTMSGTLYIPSLSRENNPLYFYQNKAAKMKNIFSNNIESNTLVTTQSSTALTQIPSNSCDYIFTDPPFGDNLNYSELSFSWECWMLHKTNINKEAIINKSHNKDLLQYQNLMMQCFSEFYRILKPNRWITVEFHNSKNTVWNALQESLSKAGFIVADIRTLDKQSGSFKQVNSNGAVKQDLVISAYKPKQSFELYFSSSVGTEETVWSFINQHLTKLPIIVEKNGAIEIINERQAYLLFDRMVAYHVLNGLVVPISANKFYDQLNQRFHERDSMYFLTDQINEYDSKRLILGVSNIQMVLNIIDEKTAIAWLYTELNTPQTYSDLQPKFLQEIRSLSKYENLPELHTLLEDNFLYNEEGKWYIPDITQSGDLLKLREKRLFKDFEQYLNSKGKLKLFRTEAIRAGFAKLWKQKDYASIIKVANRLPEQVIQEDDKLLMYYDISLSRVE